jgi:hypothetical protein
MLKSQSLQQLDAVRTRHLEVGQNEIEAGVFARQVKQFRGGGRGVNFVSFGPK